MLPNARPMHLSSKRIVRISLSIAAIKRRSIISIEFQPLSQSVWQIRVSNEPPSEHDRISPIGIQRCESVVAAVVTRRKELDVCFLKDGAEGRKGVVSGRGGSAGADSLDRRAGPEGVELGVLREDLVETRLDHVDICEAMFSGESCDLLAHIRPVLVGIAVLGVLEVVVRRETDARLVGANCRSHALDDFEGELCAPFDRAAVGIGAHVDVVVQELVQEIAVRRVNLYSVEAGFNSTLGSRTIFNNELGDLFCSEGLWWGCAVGITSQAVAGNGYVAGGNGRDAPEERWDGCATYVPELTEDETSLGVHGIGDLLPACDLAGSKNAWNIYNRYQYDV